MENNNEDIQSFQALRECGDFDILSYSDVSELDDTSKYTKLNLSPAQRSQVSAFMQNVPMAMASGAMANAYVVKFPEGLPHSLVALKQGGFGSMIRGENGFVGTASFYNMTTQAAMLSAFTAMSVATGQYFMAQINSQLDTINKKMDDILGFLYGDKKAELLSELNFVRFAYENFSSICMIDTQRIATIGSLQSAKKVAIKDIEFYLGDLDLKVNSDVKNYSGLERVCNDSVKIKQSLDLSVQLYIMSNLLEMQYSQNMDKSYVTYLESEMTQCITRCSNRILSNFSKLKGKIDSYKESPVEKISKIDKTDEENLIGNIIESLKIDEELPMRNTIKSVLESAVKQNEYFVKKDGSLYVAKE